MTNTTTKLEAINAAYNEMVLSENVIRDEKGNTWYLGDAEVAKQFNDNDDIFVENVDAIKLDNDNEANYLPAAMIANIEDYTDQDIDELHDLLVNKKFHTTLLINNRYRNMSDVYDENTDEYEIEAAKERNNI